MVRARGLEVVRVYEEQASAVKHRPAFERMMQDAREGKFKVLVIWALDRFGRSMSGNIRDVVELDRLGVRVLSVREPWMDTSGPVRELLVAIFSWVAQQERDRLIERTKAGIAVSRARGVAWGRRSAAIGGRPLKEIRVHVAKWAIMGQVGGLFGLAKELGGCSTGTARKYWLMWGADIMDAARLAGVRPPDYRKPGKPPRITPERTGVSKPEMDRVIEALNAKIIRAAARVVAASASKPGPVPVASARDVPATRAVPEREAGVPYQPIVIED